MNDEDFDGSAMRELLAPAVADRGLTSAPTDAIVAAGRRRVVGRRTAVAGGALAIVAAVPLAASAIAAGPGTAGTTNSASRTGTPGGAQQIQHGGTGTGTPPAKAPAKTPAKTPAKGDPAGLPAKPYLMTSGTVEGHSWSVTALTTGGNNALTAGDKCLGLVVRVDGRTSLGGSDPMLPYCVPLPAADPKGPVWYYPEELKYDFTGGAGTLEMGLVPSDVAKIVAHADGLAPLTATTIPAPGLAAEALYFLPIPKDDSFRVSFDEYDAKGTEIGTFNNWTPLSGITAPSTPAKK